MTTAQGLIDARAPLDRWTLAYASRIFPIYGDTDYRAVSEHDTEDEAVQAKKCHAPGAVNVFVVLPPGWIRPPTTEEHRAINGAAMLRSVASGRCAASRAARSMVCLDEAARIADEAIVRLDHVLRSSRPQRLRRERRRELARQVRTFRRTGRWPSITAP